MCLHFSKRKTLPECDTKNNNIQSKPPPAVVVSRSRTSCTPCRLSTESDEKRESRDSKDSKSAEKTQDPNGSPVVREGNTQTMSCQTQQSASHLTPVHSAAGRALQSKSLKIHGDKNKGASKEKTRGSAETVKKPRAKFGFHHDELEVMEQMIDDEPTPRIPDLDVK